MKARAPSRGWVVEPPTADVSHDRMLVVTAHAGATQAPMIDPTEVPAGWTLWNIWPRSWRTKIASACEIPLRSPTSRTRQQTPQTCVPPRQTTGRLLALSKRPEGRTARPDTSGQHRSSAFFLRSRFSSSASLLVSRSSRSLRSASSWRTHLRSVSVPIPNSRATSAIVRPSEVRYKSIARALKCELARSCHNSAPPLANQTKIESLQESGGTSDRVKTDAGDAELLAHLLKLGEIVDVNVSSVAQEAARDLVPGPRGCPRRLDRGPGIGCRRCCCGRGSFPQEVMRGRRSMTAGCAANGSTSSPGSWPTTRLRRPWC
jgi:hypothetical protein